MSYGGPHSIRAADVSRLEPHERMRAKQHMMRYDTTASSVGNVARPARPAVSKLSRLEIPTKVVRPPLRPLEMPQPSSAKPGPLPGISPVRQAAALGYSRSELGLPWSSSNPALAAASGAPTSWSPFVSEAQRRFGATAAAGSQLARALNHASCPRTLAQLTMPDTAQPMSRTPTSYSQLMGARTPGLMGLTRASSEAALPRARTPFGPPSERYYFQPSPQGSLGAGGSFTDNLRRSRMRY